MKARISFTEALADPNILGHALAGESFVPHRAMAKVWAGEADQLTPDEINAFRQRTQRDPISCRLLRETWLIAGRRAGKDELAATFAAGVATCWDFSDVLSHGETGTVLLIAPDTRQAVALLDRIEGVLKASPMLAKMIEKRNSETLELSNGIVIEVQSANFRRLRGKTCVVVIANETAFWHSDESSNPDTEILGAVRPTLLTTGGLLICITSPYARKGETWEMYSRYFGKDDADILIAHGSTVEWNPTVDQAFIDKQFERDPASARAEYGGIFRTDVETFIRLEAVQACIQKDCFERAPDRSQRYFAFVDAASGSGTDSFTLAIAHRQGVTAILDLVREIRPPFSPEAAVEEIANVLRRFRITKAIADRWGGDFVVEAFKRQSINLSHAEKTKSEYYLDFLSFVNSGACDLLDNDRLVRQLVGLERRVTRTGRDMVDHPPVSGAHDDVANAAAAVIVEAASHRAGWGLGLIPAPDDTSVHVGNLAGEHGVGRLSSTDTLTRMPKVVRGYDQQKRDNRRY